MIYLAGGDPEHLLHAYREAKEHNGTLAFVSLDSNGEVKLRVPVLPYNPVVIVGDERWLPILEKIVVESKAVLSHSILLPTTQWTVRPPDES